MEAQQYLETRIACSFSMEDQNNINPYRAQVSLDSKYTPIIQRGKFLHEQVSKSTFPEKRKAGHTNLDLWLDGTLYPKDSRTQKHPKFTCLKELLEFVGDGTNGLLGYVTNIEQQSTEIIRSEYTDQIAALQVQVWHLQSEIQINKEKLQVIPGFINEIQKLQADKILFQERLQALQMEVHVGYAEKLGLEVQCRLVVEEKEHLCASHHSQLQKIQSELSQSKLALKRMAQRLESLKKTPLGYRSQVRRRRDLSTLVQSGGHAKSQKRLARSIVGCATMLKVQKRNAEEGCSGRLYGDNTSQVETGRVFASLLSRVEMESILETPKMNSVGKKLVNSYMDKIGSSVGSAQILESCDRNGITLDGYNAVYKKFKGAIQGNGLRVGFLPNPHQVNLLRRQMNCQLEELIGSFYSINDILTVPVNAKLTNKDLNTITLNNMNSFFADVEMVQATMVRLYGITPQELQGDPLIFVIKLDEAEIIYGQKMERVSITLMNRALDPSFRGMTAVELKKDNRYFSVQSEREVWPIASFQVPKESHAILDWVFKRTKIPELIAAQESGQLLNVLGVGEFKVQWHLSADMKTIKVMYGLKHGANCLHTCIYCNQERSKPTVTTTAQAILTLSKKTQAWSGGLFSTAIHSKPVLGACTLGRWKPILPIPLDRVHICTLHALNRIVEKILHLHFIFVWTMRDKQVQELAIKELQKILSATGAHGGNVLIFKDQNLSGKSNSVPNKPSLSGANCSKIFKASTLLGGSDKVWKDIVNATHNYTDGGAARRTQLQMWAALDDLQQYFVHLTLTNDQISEFKKKVENWGHLILKSFGENHVTQYMHIVVKHAPWFVSEYGSLSVWSCQGMEASHHAAKATYHRHTQHAGGKFRKSPLLQTFEHWYRIIQHRFRNKEDLEMHNEVANASNEDVVAARRERSINSSASAHWEDWRANCTRQGSRWVPNEHTNISN